VAWLIPFGCGDGRVTGDTERFEIRDFRREVGPGGAALDVVYIVSERDDSFLGAVGAERVIVQLLAAQALPRCGVEEGAGLTRFREGVVGGFCICLTFDSDGLHARGMARAIAVNAAE
jgi:hypothetical protein